MFHKEYTLRTHQSDLILKKNNVEKYYIQENHEKNKLSSVKNEMICINKFSKDNKLYSPEIMSSNDISYIMKRYDFSLGNTKRIDENKVRRLLFSCSLKNILNQLKDIEKILKEKNIKHNDINPGNILFYEKERQLKLIDFYWASTDSVNVKPIRGINGIYKKDDEAFKKICNEIININKKVKKEVDKSKLLISNLGKKYYDGSSKHKGKTYHPIDIHYYKDNLYHKDINYEFNNIINHINYPIETVIDVGCAAGYYLFNLIRMNDIKKIIGHENDPVMLSFLKNIKDIFCLDEIILESGVTPITNFEEIDLVICMNVHMWLVKEFNKDADNIISKLIKKSKQMFFQTAGLESSGMYLVKSLKNKQDIIMYLENLGGKNIKLIDTSKRGGLRYLFKIGDI